jgi:hypothetical protein
MVLLSDQIKELKSLCINNPERLKKFILARELDAILHMTDKEVKSFIVNKKNKNHRKTFYHERAIFWDDAFESNQVFEMLIPVIIEEWNEFKNMGYIPTRFVLEDIKH